ncbi:MAG: hypothetical protein WKF31_01750 [Thermoleophilaceae bacterium]
MSALADRARSPWFSRGLATAVLLGAAVLPFFFDSGGPFIEDLTVALAYVVMALGLNIVVGFAGLLDLGYVAFFAIGAYTIGWFGSGFFSAAGVGRASTSGSARWPPSCRAFISTSSSSWSSPSW